MTKPATTPPRAVPCRPPPPRPAANPIFFLDYSSTQWIVLGCTPTATLSKNSNRIEMRWGSAFGFESALLEADAILGSAESLCEVGPSAIVHHTKLTEKAGQDTHTSLMDRCSQTEDSSFPLPRNKVWKPVNSFCLSPLHSHEIRVLTVSRTICRQWAALGRFLMHTIFILTSTHLRAACAQGRVMPIILVHVYLGRLPHLSTHLNSRNQLIERASFVDSRGPSFVPTHSVYFFLSLL